MAKINNEIILLKQADSQLSENVYFIDIQPVGYLLSVNEVQLSLGGAPVSRPPFWNRIFDTVCRVNFIHFDR